MISCYKSTPSKIIMLFNGIISILISVYKSYNLKFIAIQSIIFYLLHIKLNAKHMEDVPLLLG